MSRLLARLERAALEREHAVLVANALMLSTAPPQARSVPLDRQRARNIPIIGASSGGGAIPGSRPGSGSSLNRCDKALKRRRG